MRASRSTWHPASPTLANEGRAESMALQKRPPTTTAAPDRDGERRGTSCRRPVRPCASRVVRRPRARRATTLAPSIAPAVRMSPREAQTANRQKRAGSQTRPRTPAAWLSGRLVSDRVDTPAHPLVSLGKRESSAAERVRHFCAESECSTSPTSVEAPSPTSPSESGSRRSERRGSRGCLEATSNREPGTIPPAILSDRRMHDVPPPAHRVPRDLLRVRTTWAGDRAARRWEGRAASDRVATEPTCPA